MQKLLLTNMYPLKFYFQYDFEFSNFVGPYTLIVNVLMMKQWYITNSIIPTYPQGICQLQIQISAKNFF